MAHNSDVTNPSSHQNFTLGLGFLSDLLCLAEIRLRENIRVTDIIHKGKFACVTLFPVIMQMGYLVCFHNSTSFLQASVGAFQTTEYFYQINYTTILGNISISGIL